MLPFRSGPIRGATAVVSVLLIAVLAFLAGLETTLAGKEEGQVRGSKKKKKLAAASASASPSGQSLSNIPLPIGHEAKGLVLPDFDLDGKLRGKFVAGSARRIDQERVGFQDLKITTYTPENRPDLQIAMRTSVLDLKTRILTSQERTVVQRADFSITGDSIQFDTGTRTGRLIGNVKMVISDQSHLMQKPNE
jgi:hypothetical protein